MRPVATGRKLLSRNAWGEGTRGRSGQEESTSRPSPRHSPEVAAHCPDVATCRWRSACSIQRMRSVAVATRCADSAAGRLVLLPFGPPDPLEPLHAIHLVRPPADHRPRRGAAGAGANLPARRHRGLSPAPGPTVPFFGGESNLVPNEFSLQMIQPEHFCVAHSLVHWAGASFASGVIQAYPASCPTVPFRQCSVADESDLAVSPPVRRLVANGTATLVPEPSAALLLLPALGGLLPPRVRRRDSRVA